MRSSRSFPTVESERIKINTGSVGSQTASFYQCLCIEKGLYTVYRNVHSCQSGVASRPACIGLPIDSAICSLMSQSLSLWCQEGIVSLRIYTQSFEFCNLVLFHGTLFSFPVKHLCTVPATARKWNSIDYIACWAVLPRGVSS